MGKKIFALWIAFVMILTETQLILANVLTDNLDRSIDYAYALLGQQKVECNMTVWQGDVDEPYVVYEKGRYGWSLDPANSTKGRYIYCSLNDKFLKNLSDGSNIEVEIEYYDSDQGTLTLEYGKYKAPIDTTEKNVLWNNKVGDVPTVELPYLDMTNSKTWRTHKFVLPRAALANSVGSADFRIGIYSTTLAYSRNRVIVNSIKVRNMGTDDIYDISVTGKNTGNIFFTGQDMEFDIAFDGSCLPYYQGIYGDVRLDIKYKLYDSNGKLVREKDGKILAKTFSKSYTSVKFEDIDRYDTYTLRVEAKNDEYKILSVKEVPCSYAFTTYGEVMNPHQGVSLSFQGNYEDAEKLAELMRNAGYSLVRINVSAKEIEIGANVRPQATNYRLDTIFDGYVKAFVDKGIKIALYTNGDGDVKVSSDGVHIPDTDEEIERWLTRQMTLLDAYGDAISYFDIDNEPNIAQPLSNDNHAARYTKAQNKLYEMAKKKYPHITFGGGTTSGRHVQWTKDFAAAGGFDGCDVYSIHPYTWEWDPILGDVTKDVKDNRDNITEIREVMDNAGYKDTEIWATEYGQSAWYLACHGLYQQAARNTQSYMMLRQNGLCEGVIKFMFTDGVNAEGRYEKETNFGTIRATKSNLLPYSAKPDYLAQSVLNYKMADAEYVERTDVEAEAAIGYRYKKTNSGKDMLVLFGNKEANTVSFDLGTKSVTLTDMFGNETTIDSPDGKYTFSIKAEPIYIEGNFTKYQMVDKAKVGPVDCRIVAAYDRVAEIPYINETGKPVEIEVETVDGSSIEILEKTDKSLKIKLGEKSREYDYLRLKISGDEKTYFNDKIAVVSNEPVAIDSKLEMKDGLWELSVNVTNNSEVSEYNGRLNVLSPEPLVGIMPSTALKIAPLETQTVSVTLPENIYPFRYQIMTVEVISDVGNIFTTFSNKLDFAYAIKPKDAVVIDGKLDEWADVCWIECNDPLAFEGVLGYDNVYEGVEDMSGKMAVMWDEDNFYFAAEIYDDKFYTSDLDRVNMWQLDDIQLGLIYDPQGTVTDEKTFEELSMSKLPSSGEQLMRHKVSANRWKDTTVVDNYQLKIERDEDVKITRYEFMVPWESITPVSGTKAAAGTELRFGALINENDGGGRKGYYPIGGGIADTKSNKSFLRVPLVEE